MIDESISIVIPAYNEEATIVSVVNEARGVLRTCRQYQVLSWTRSPSIGAA